MHIFAIISCSVVSGLLFFKFVVQLFTVIFCVLCRYASRVRCIVNDTSKHVAPKEIMRLKKLISYWKEQAGKRSEGDELEEIQEERVSKEKADTRLTA